jgi:hypothetical protein
MVAIDFDLAAARATGQAPPPEPEPPRPLTRELPPADPFPVDALGSVLGAAAKAIGDRVQAPLAICGQSVLGAANLALQGHVDVVLPIGPGRAKPISNFLITIGESGERKTECDNQALWPIRAHEKKLRAEHDERLPNYFNEKAAWDRAREFALKAGKGDKAKIRVELEALGPAPSEPLTPMLTCEEPTVEGLHKLFGTGWPSLGIFTAEGGRFIGGHGMNDDAKLRTATSLSTLWDGEPIKRVRAGDAPIIMPGRRLSLHLMIQPVVSDILLSDDMLSGQGLLSRLLVSAPESTAGTRFRRDEQPETDHDIKRYGARLLSILETPLPLVAGKSNELDPPSVPLSDRARALWSSFADHVEREIRSGGDLEPIRGLANKLPEHAARLAAVLALVRDIRSVNVSAEYIEAGIGLSEHYAAEALRLFGASRVSGDIRLAQRLLEWLFRWPEPHISLPDIYQGGPTRIRDKATAAKIVGILEDHGWMRRVADGAVIGGQRRREAWLVIRA